MSQKKVLSYGKDIKPVLAKFDTNQLCKLLQDLYQFSSENKAFFHSRFSNNLTGNDHLEVYKTRIAKAVCPHEPWKQDYKLSAGRKVISEFKKANGNLKDTLTLMFHYVKCGNDFTLEFGDIDEPFYDSMDSMFHSIVKALIKHKNKALVKEFMPKLEAELKRVEDLGWGYRIY